MPRRSSVFGVPPSTIHTSVPPPSFGTSTWIQACGFTSSTLTILPLSNTGRLASNSAPKAWCATTGTAVASRSPAPAIAIISVFFIDIALSPSVLTPCTGFRLLGCLFVLQNAGTFHYADHCVVAFVTRVLVQLIAGPANGPGVFTRPRLVPGRRIFNCKPIEERFVVDAVEPFGDLQTIRRAAEPRLVVEVGRLNDQGIAFPPPDRVAKPIPDAIGPMRRPVEMDDSHVVNHLGEDHDVILGLHHLLHVVVEVGRQHRRT